MPVASLSSFVARTRFGTKLAGQTSQLATLVRKNGITLRAKPNISFRISILPTFTPSIHQSIHRPEFRLILGVLNFELVGWGWIRFGWWLLRFCSPWTLAAAINRAKEGAESRFLTQFLLKGLMIPMHANTLARFCDETRNSQAYFPLSISLASGLIFKAGNSNRIDALKNVFLFSFLAISSV